MNLKKLAGVTVVAVVAAFACAAIAARADDAKSSSVVHVSSKTGKWVEGPAPGVQSIAIRGDMKKGPYAMFVKFPPAADHGWHTHTNDVSILVLSGAYLYKDESGMEKRVGPGEYFSVPGGHKHWSGGDATEGCVFFNEGSAMFDLNPVEAPSGGSTK